MLLKQTFELLVKNHHSKLIRRCKRKMQSICYSVLIVRGMLGTFILRRADSLQEECLSAQFTLNKISHNERPSFETC